MTSCNRYSTETSRSFGTVARVAFAGNGCSVLYHIHQYKLGTWHSSNAVQQGQPTQPQLVKVQSLGVHIFGGIDASLAAQVDTCIVHEHDRRKRPAKHHSHSWGCRAQTRQAP